MGIFNTKRLSGQPPLPTRELWRALLVIYRHYLAGQVAWYMPVPTGSVEVPPRRVTDAIRLLDCWLEKAIDEKWIDESWIDEAHEHVD